MPATAKAAPAAPSPAPTPAAAPAAKAPSPKTKGVAIAQPSEKPVAERAVPVQEPGNDVVRVRAYERAKKVKEDLEAEEGPADEADDGDEESVEARPAKRKAVEKPKAKPDGEETEEKPAVDHAAERAKRIEAMRAKERQNRQEVHARQRPAPQTQQQAAPAADLAKMQAELSRLQALEAQLGDEDGILSYAEQSGKSAEKLIAAIKRNITDPGAVAQKHATAEADKLRVELARMAESVEQRFAALDQEKRTFNEQRQAQARAQSFIGQVGDRTESHPLTANLMKRHKPEGLIAFANQFVAPLLPEGYDLDELHDHVEQLLHEMQVAAAESPQPAAPANGVSRKPKSGADEPATTLSNALGSGRATVTEAIPLHTLPLAERVRRLKAQLGDG